MTFFESIRVVFRKYAEFGGRATRPEFWWFTLFSALVSAALSALTPYTVVPPVTDAVPFGYAMMPVINLAGFWSVAVLLPSLAVAVRRLRDAGRAWTELFWILLPIAGLIVLIIRFTEPSIPVLADPAVETDAPA